MYLNTIQHNTSTCSRILIVTEERTLQEDLRISHALQNTNHSVSSSSVLGTSLGSSKAKSVAPPPDVVCTANEKEALALVEAAAQEHKPFSLVIIDGRLFYGKDYRHVINRLWQIQRDMHVVLHAVSQLESFEQIPIDLGANPQLLVFKFRLVPFEITQLIRTLSTRHGVEHQSSHRNLSLNAQLLEVTTRFEDVSNRLRLEQDHRRQLEDQLCRNQRLETVGRFADAMAHFFNNYLTVIQGHLEVAQFSQDGGSVAATLKELIIATQRASGVTSQFVSFNRREYLQPTPLHLGQIIDGQTSMLQKALGEQIEIQISHKPDLPAVMADQASLEQIIFNLLIHARESMPGGGRLMIQTRELSIPDAETASQIHPEARAGNYVVMTISDTGKGMTAAELSGLFDTAKLSSDPAGGADIALILVQGLVRMQAGWIDARSVLEVGTEFSIHLPVATGAAPTSGSSTPEKKLLSNNAEDEASTILIVDDEDSVRQVMEYVLTSQGHKVLTAADANEAWAIWREKASVIKLALIDVKLPGGVSGFDLEKALAAEDPTLPVIFTCGYSPTTLSNAKELKAGENFLPKPFGMVELLNIVGQALLKPARL